MKIVLLLLCLFSLSAVAHSQGIKMKIPGITTASAGEDVIAFETGDTTSGSSASGSGAGATLVSFEMIKIKKLQDVSTNELFKRSISNTHTQDATFEFFNAANVMFYKIVIKDFTINHFSYLSPECTGCAKLYHQVWFDYKQIEATDVATGVSVKYNRSTKVFY